MTGILHPKPPTQPHPKAASTAQLTSIDAVDNNVTAKTENVAKPKAPRIRHNVQLDPTSNVATISLIRRVLVKDGSSDTQTVTTSLDDSLPPLTSSNDVDIQLYAIIAIIIKDFVNVWYSKITSDHLFVEEIIQIIAHCCRALEERLRHVDLPQLFLNDVPVLLQEHVEGYRTATRSLAHSPYATRPDHIYHELYPHPALSPVPEANNPDTVSQQDENERAYRQLLMEGTLAILLPTEDLQNRPLRTLVVDIFADLIIGQALAGKICESWFIHEAITKAITIVNAKVQPKASGSEMRDGTKNRLEKFGLLSSENRNADGDSPLRHRSTFAAWFWRIMQYGYLTVLFLRHVLKGLHRARNLPKRTQSAHATGASPTVAKTLHLQGLGTDGQTPLAVIEYRFYAFVSTLLTMGERMPWIASTGSFWQQALLHGSGRIGALNSTLDRFLHKTINTEAFPLSLLPIVLLNLRSSLFPNNSMGPAAPPAPSIEEQTAIKRRAAESILSLIPPFVAKQYYSSTDHEEILNQIEQDMLDPFGDKYLNKHVVYRVLELILVKMLPELGEQDIGELFNDRGVSWDEEVDTLILRNDGKS